MLDPAPPASTGPVLCPAKAPHQGVFWGRGCPLPTLYSQVTTRKYTEGLPDTAQAMPCRCTSDAPTVIPGELGWSPPRDPKLTVAVPQLVPEEMQTTGKSQRNVEALSPVANTFSDGKAQGEAYRHTQEQDTAALSVYKCPDPNTQSCLEVLMKTQDG